MDEAKRRLLKFLGAGSLISYSALKSGNLSAFGKSNHWKKAPSLKRAIQEIYPAIFNNELYVGGGFTTSRNPLFYNLGLSNELNIFSFKQQAWRRGPQLPVYRHHLGFATTNKFLYAIGGFYGEKGDIWQTQKTVHRLNLDTWESGPELPIPLGESVFVTHDNRIHVIGGRSLSSVTQKNVDTDSHYVLIDDKKWEKAAPPSISRNSAAGARIGNRIYVVAGRQYKDGLNNLSYAEAYDVSRDKWEPIAPLPKALAGLSAIEHNGKLIVTGGEAFPKNGAWKAGTAFNNIWSYDPVSGRWIELAPMPSSRHGHGSVLFESRIYIVGGAMNVGPRDTLASMEYLEL